eukprot:7552499-Pyramimonas_sp.AAC.1
MAVKCDLVDAAVHHDKGAHARQTVRITMRECLAPTCDSEKGDLIGTLKAEGIRGQGSVLRSSVNARSGSRLPFAANLFMEAIFLT